MQLGISDIALTMVVPWSLPDDLQDDTSEQKTVIERIFKEEVIFFKDCSEFIFTHIPKVFVIMQYALCVSLSWRIL